MKPSDLKVSTPWLPVPPQRGPSAAGTILKAAIGLGVAGLFWLAHLPTLALVVASIALAISGVALASPRARVAIERAFARLGAGLGQGLSWVLLAPLFFLLFPGVRLFHALSGRDPLLLRKAEAPTWWLPAAEESRRARSVRALYAAERVDLGRRWPTRLLGGLLLLVATEITLRIMGFGDPLLYVSDPVVGYHPAPNQDVVRRGQHITTNAFGMRSGPVDRVKPPGTFRVLVLGDSTAFGGTYIDQADIYTSRLQGLLSAQAGGRPVEVLNASANGWGPFHALGYVQTMGTFECDLALITLPYGDVFRPLTGLSTKPYSSASHPPRLALVEVGLHLMWRLREASVGKTPAARNDAQGQRGLGAYAELARLLKAGGAEVRVEVLPTPAAGLRSEVRELERVWVDALVAQVDAPVGFPVGLFQDLPNAYADFIHLADPGHARYAQWLAATVGAQSAAFRAFAAR